MVMFPEAAAIRRQQVEQAGSVVVRNRRSNSDRNKDGKG